MGELVIFLSWGWTNVNVMAWLQNLGSFFYDVWPTIFAVLECGYRICYNPLSRSEVVYNHSCTPEISPETKKTMLFMNAHPRLLDSSEEVWTYLLWQLK